MEGGRWSDKYDYEENYGETAGQLEISDIRFKVWKAKMTLIL